MSNALHEASRAWRSALGEAHVVTDPAALAAAATATFATNFSIPAILRPADTTQVAAVLRIASRYRVPLYPVSRGRNWGFGSRVPAAEGCALLDLSRMDRIVELNDRLAYAVIEPGVSFRQLHAFLRRHNARCFMPNMGGPSDASVIGNTLERGDAASHYGDRPAHVCNFEAVLADGTIMRTGYGRFPNAAAAHTGRYGVGPELDGLFFQSNFGVVTRMTAWLQPIPEAVGRFVGRLAGTGSLEAFIEALRPLALHEVLRPNEIGIWNTVKLLALQGPRPAPMPDTASWHFGGALYSASEQLAAAGLLQASRSLRPASTEWSASLLAGAALDASIGEIGKPSDQNVGSLYWRKSSRPRESDFDPGHDRCGALWLCPEFPLEGAPVCEAMAEIEALVAHHGFEPNIGLVLAGPRSIRVYVALMYDRDVAGEDERALACHDALLEAMLRRGAYPYRLGLQSMRAFPRAFPALQAIKQALDPHRIIAPGRYD